MARFIVSTNLPPSIKRAGFTHEVVDSTHPSDGGPVAIAWFKSARRAVEDAAARNENPAIPEHRVPA